RGATGQRGKFARKMEGAVENRVEEWFLAESISRGEQLFRSIVVDGKCKHPLEPLDARWAEFLEGVQDRFRIGIRSKPVPFRFKQRPERSMVVDLTVERNPARTVLVRHRLVAASAIDDCKPAMPEHDARVLMEAFTVRPAVRDGVRHRLDGLSCVSSKR